MRRRRQVPPQAVIDGKPARHFPGVLQVQRPLLRTHAVVVRSGLDDGAVISQQPTREAEPGAKTVQTIYRRERIRGRIRASIHRHARIILNRVSLKIGFGSEFVGVLTVNPRRIGIVGWLVVMVKALDLTNRPDVLYATGVIKTGGEES